MQDLQHLLWQYLRDCRYQKSLDPKTLKACQIDLAQFSKPLSAVLRHGLQPDGQLLFH